MRIKKVSQTTPVQAQIVDGYSTSTTDGYSANYINQYTEDSGWIEITPTLGTAGTGYYVPMYRKIGNIVHLRGQIQGVTAITTALFTLPSGFYNTTSRKSFCTTNDSTQINFVRVLNTGIVQLQKTTGDVTSSDGVRLYLDGISFPVD